MSLANRIKVTTSTTGTGSLTLSSTGVRDSTNGDFLAPAEVGTELANRLAPYFITSGGNFAYGMGLISTNGLTLTRDPFEMRWNGSAYTQALLSLTGTSTVIISPGAVDLDAATIGTDLVYRSGFVAL